MKAVRHLRDGQDSPRLVHIRYVMTRLFFELNRAMHMQMSYRSGTSAVTSHPH